MSTTDSCSSPASEGEHRQRFGILYIWKDDPLLGILLLVGLLLFGIALAGRLLPPTINRDANAWSAAAQQAQAIAIFMAGFGGLVSYAKVQRHRARHLLRVRGELGRLAKSIADRVKYLRETCDSKTKNWKEFEVAWAGFDAHCTEIAGSLLKAMETRVKDGTSQESDARLDSLDTLSDWRDRGYFRATQYLQESIRELIAEMKNGQGEEGQDEKGKEEYQKKLEAAWAGAYRSRVFDKVLLWEKDIRGWGDGAA